MTTIIPLPKLHPYIFSSLMRNKLCTSELSLKAINKVSFRSFPTIMNVPINNIVEEKDKKNITISETFTLLTTNHFGFPIPI